jgi:hypothetical protein
VRAAVEQAAALGAVAPLVHDPEPAARRLQDWRERIGAAVDARLAQPGPDNRTLRRRLELASAVWGTGLLAGLVAHAGEPADETAGELREQPTRGGYALERIVVSEAYNGGLAAERDIARDLPDH